MNIPRRNFLQLMLIYSFLGKSEAASRDYFYNIDVDQWKRNHQGMLKECHTVYLSWISSEPIAPKLYLSKLGVNVFQGKGALTQIIRQDFKDQKTFIVNGLVLSKTEACLIAGIGEVVYFT